MYLKLNHVNIPQHSCSVSLWKKYMLKIVNLFFTVVLMLNTVKIYDAETEQKTVQ